VIDAISDPLPPGASAVVFSPLLDDRAIGAITDLHHRGHPAVVLDTLATEPPASARTAEALALRLWRLDRAALRVRLSGHGIPVADLRSPEDLDAAVAGLRPYRHRRPARRSRS
jgi:uncharacterized protein (DUF58 family)